MNVDDLMLGDWVFDKGNECYWQHNIKDYRCENRILFEFEPIPLTPEILEKNGFRETDVVVVGTRKMRWESEDTRTEITIWMDDTMPMEIRKNIYYEDEVCYTLPFAWAVHKLQHALRLCGIEKEVVL